MSKKKSKSEILEKIVKSLSESPKTIYRLSKELNSNWDTIKNNITLLEDLNVVEKPEGKVYLKSEVCYRQDTLVGIPISKESRKKIYSLAKEVNSSWQDMVGESPSRTQLQKAVVEVADEFPDLNIPRGWYLFGKVVLANIDSDKFEGADDHEFDSPSEDLNNKISSIVEKISRKTHSELLNYQYDKYEREDYLTKLEIIRLFNDKSFDVGEFRNYMYKLIFNYPLVEDSEFSHKVLDLIKESTSVIIDKTAKTDMSSYSEKERVNEMFSTHWKIYATHALYESIEGEINYDKRFIESILNKRVDFYSHDLTDTFNNYAPGCM